MSTPDPAAARAFARAHETLLARPDLQLDFPGFAPEKTPDWVYALQKFLGNFAPVLKVLFWAGVAAAAAMVLYLIGRELLNLRVPVRVSRVEPNDLREQLRPTAEEARILLEDADKLAAQGRFADAVHLLLLRSIQDINAKLPDRLRPALTSREIGTLSELPAAIRDLFSAIARVVERSRFGGRPVGAEDYARCRAEYERFAFPDSWRAAA